MHDRLNAAERKEVDYHVEHFMRYTLEEITDYLRNPIACACIGPPPGGIHCWCNLREVALNEALGRCNLRRRP